MYSRPLPRSRPIWTALLAPLLALGLTGLFSPSATLLTASQQPETSAQPAGRERVERLSQRATERAQALQAEAEADALASRERTLLEEIRRLDLDRQIKTAELDAIDDDVAETTTRLADAAARIAALEEEAATQRPLVEARLVELYKLGRASYTRLLFSGGDLRALGRTYRLIGSLARRDQERFDGHRQTIAALAASRATLESRQVEAGSLLSEARAARNAVDRAIDAQTALVAEIDARRDLTALLAGELVAARERLDSTLEGLGNDGVLAAAPVALPLGPFRGQLEPPVPGEVTVAFGSAQTSEFGTSIARAGIELAAVPGESVYAIHGGTVAHAGPFEGLGTLVIINHGDQAFSLYGYLGALAVHTGVQVAPRTLLGTAARSPTGTPAVYFELRIDGRPVDPIEWFE